LEKEFCFEVYTRPILYELRNFIFAVNERLARILETSWDRFLFIEIWLVVLVGLRHHGFAQESKLLT
jgi:hypothetical protein